MLEAENFRLRARAASALSREATAEALLMDREEKLLFLQRRSFHWYLMSIRRFFLRLAGRKG
ncbi:hypothetical protein ACNHKD_09475 [Methylocystis sp. JAN1]|uniref:hypothetical protein n=1 Tax=Methylocystis sp. JAN1 TaxID=3397211 RepID=UPI003FA27D1F